MCGIAAVVNEKDAARKVFEMLLFMQHRGQDSCGIVSFDLQERKFYRVKARGLLDNLESKVNECSGDIAIGHVRYSTAGKSLEAQPIVVKGKKVIAAMCHNGNIINRKEIRKKISKEFGTEEFETDIDVEELLRFFLFSFETSLKKYKSQEIEIKNSFHIVKALKNTYEFVRGVYSALAIVGGEEPFFIAFRDKFGVRPLYYGKSKENGFFFASESIALEKFGVKAEELEYGNAIIIERKKGSLIKTERNIEKEKYKPCIFELIYFAFPASYVFGESVSLFRERLGEILAREFLKKYLAWEEIDYVCDVPSTSKTAAISFAQFIDKPYLDGIQRNYYVPRTFIMSKQVARENKIRFKINIDPRLKNKNIVVIDDSIVRGTTSKYLINELRKKGVKKIFYVVTAPPIKFPCVYGIDMAMPDELIAGKKTIEEIRKMIGVEALFYMPLEKLKEATELSDFCDACFSGKYPIKPTKEELEDIIRDRKEKER